MAHIKLIDGSNLETMESRAELNLLIESSFYAPTTPIITVSVRERLSAASFIKDTNAETPTTIVITNILTIND